MELFKSLKETMNARSKFNGMDKKLKAKIIDFEHNGVKIKMNAKNEFLELSLPEQLLSSNKEKIEKTVLDAFQKASEKAQKIMAEEAKANLAGLKIPGLS